MVNKVSIEKLVYDSLIEDNIKYDLLKIAIFNSANLDLFDELRFDSEELQKAIKVLEPHKYQVVQTELINQRKLEKENGVESNE